MTWDEACKAMVEGKRVRLPHWNTWLSIGFHRGNGFMDMTTLADGYRQFSPELAHVLSKAWQVVE